MKRTLTCFTMAFVAVAAAGEAHGQEDGAVRRPSRFDIGVYAGGTLTSSWYKSRTVLVTTTREPSETTLTDQGEQEEFGFGYAPAFGALANFWVTPGVGLRAHYGYVPARIPMMVDGFFDVTPGDADNDDSYVLNNHFYDLSLVFRPFTRSGMAPLLSSVYLFVGGGGLTTDLAGEDRPICEPRTLAQGGCLSYEPDHASVGQVTAGAGIDLFRLTNSIGIFGELAAHGYDSPVHVGEPFVPAIEVRSGQTTRVADDRIAVTARLAAGLKLMLGGGAPPVVAVAAPPPPPPVQAAPPPPAEQAIRVCVIEGGQLREVEAMFNPATGDTMVAGRRFSEAYPATTGYAGTADFFVQDQPVRFRNREYVRYGLPRIVTVTDVTPVGDFQGVQVFAEPTANAQNPDVIYLPVRPGCEFQPYQRRTAVRARG